MVGHVTSIMKTYLCRSDTKFEINTFDANLSDRPIDNHFILFSNELGSKKSNGYFKGTE